MKGIILAAGYGTRFLPVTKTIPKEMLPIVNVPSIAFIVDEFVKSGIEDIIIVSSRRKKALEDYFDREIELESIFEREGKTKLLERITPPANVRFAFIRQQRMLGTGHALLQVKSFVGDSPCIVAYPDDLHIGEPPLSSQLIEAWRETGCSVMATVYEKDDVSRYGVLDIAADGKHVRAIVEKPMKGTEPSHEVSIGRYLYTPDFFNYLEEGWERHEGGEYYHIYALNKLMNEGRVVYKRLSGHRMDTGEPEGYLEAILRYAESIPSLKRVLDNYIALKKG
ncbi:UTP--glucose-1-phosphate uridylyltransferase [Breznakiella homolactica]|uniref:UTP--glucose-1-phosphate uridylyltransferase n=1 Tax=Breznakiella homolactica TaxID=2798577 RepID=A0A7T7XMV4_9SPIR|nr:UTP--glucose-1-phosphate uridylyltransferase [Breznakiella homolactica]QQO09250.1 UTP--glucose-1-phosphate uridylyltransferase [Breznakiella homolactica]